MKRIFSVLLAAAMVLSMLPVMALAAGTAVAIYENPRSVSVINTSLRPVYRPNFGDNRSTYPGGGIPYGETVYYRLKDSVSGSTIVTASDDSVVEGLTLQSAWTNGCGDLVKDYGLCKITNNANDGMQWYMYVTFKNEAQLIADGVYSGAGAIPDKKTLSGGIRIVKDGTTELSTSDFSGAQLIKPTGGSYFIASATLGGTFYDMEHARKKVTGLSDVAETENGGVIGPFDWTGSAAPAGVGIIPAGGTVYYALTRSEGYNLDFVLWDNYVRGFLPGGAFEDHEITVPWTQGGGLVNKVYLTKRTPYNSCFDKWYLAVELKNDAVSAPQALTGTVTIKNSDAVYGTDADITLAVSQTVVPAGSGADSFRVTGIDGRVQTEQGGAVGLFHWNGDPADTAGATFAKRGGTMYFALKDSLGSTVTLDESVAGATVTSQNFTSGADAVGTVSVVKKKYNAADEKYFLAMPVTGSGFGRLTGSVTVTNDTADTGFNTPDNTITLNVDLLLADDATYPGQNGDNSVVNRYPAVAEMVYNPYATEGSTTGYVGFFDWSGAGRGSTTSLTYIPEGETVYYPLRANGRKSGYLNAVEAQEYVYGATADLSGLTVSGYGGDVNDVLEARFVAMPGFSNNTNGTMVSRWHLALTVKPGAVALGAKSFLGTVSITNDMPFYGFSAQSGYGSGNTISLPVNPMSFRITDGLLEIDDGCVVGANDSQVQILRSDGRMTGITNWDGSRSESGATYLPWGKTVYFSLKDRNGTVVADSKYVNGAAFDLSGLQIELQDGGVIPADGYVSSSIQAHPYDSTLVPKYYVALSAASGGGLQGARLTGALRIVKDSAQFGFNTPDGSIRIAVDLPLGEPQESRVSGINQNIQSEYGGFVAAQTVSGETPDGAIASIPYGYTAYYPLINEQGGAVSDNGYVEDAFVSASWTSNGALVQSVELVKMRYRSGSSAMRWFVAVTLIPEPENAANAQLRGTVTLENADTTKFTVPAITLNISSLTVTAKTRSATPTEGDTKRLFAFALLGNRYEGVWPLVENEDGGVERVVGHTGTAYTGDTPFVPWKSTVYYLLEDCDGNYITDGKYIENIKVTEDWMKNGSRVNGVGIVKKRLDLGDGVHEGLYCYFLAVTFVDREYMTSRSTVEGTLTLSKKGKYGIATEDNTLAVNICVYLTKEDATLREDYTERYQFADRVLSDEPTRYNFVDPAYGQSSSASWTALGTDEQDVIYLTEEQDVYFTVDTRRQGRTLLYCKQVGDPFLYDVYPDAKLRFLICGGDSFHKKGVLTIGLPGADWRLYELVGGRLVEPTSGVYDEDALEWNITTKKLRSWCLSDTELDLDAQYYFVYDEFHYAVEGMSRYSPTPDISTDLLEDALSNYPDDAQLTVYVQPGVTMGAQTRRWLAENLKKPLELVSSRGWSIRFEPGAFSEKAASWLVFNPVVTSTAQSVVLTLDGNGLEPYGLQIPFTLAHPMLAAMKAPNLYGKAGDGTYVDFGPVAPEQNTVRFTLGRDMTYLITDVRYPDAVAAKEYFEE